ncbi:hypothetical protein HBA92_21560 [Ochrobactrum sp. MR28]|nr:hypothetical protein [Ochrobactrum sp. MR28]
MAYVEILNDDVEERSGRNERGLWSVRRQQAYLHQGAPYPEPFPIFLTEEMKPYKAGKYLFAGGAFVNMKGVWSFGRNAALIPFADAMHELKTDNSSLMQKPSTVAA